MKTRAKLFIISAFLAILLAGCDKCPNLTGQVLEYGTNKPIQNAAVTVYSCTATPDLLTTNCDAGKTDSTDADGYYLFDQTAGDILTAEASGYHPTESGGLAFSGTKDCSEPIDVHLYPHAWIRFVAINQTGVFNVFATHSDAHLGQYVNFTIPIGDTTVINSRWRGNLHRDAQFSVWYTETGPSLKDSDSLNCFVNGVLIPATWASGMSVPIFLSAHDTAEVKVIF